jgi:hypothetical protein
MRLAVRATGKQRPHDEKSSVSPRRLRPVLPNREMLDLDGFSSPRRLNVGIVTREPLIGPATHLFFPVAVFGLQLSLELLIVTFDLQQIIVGKVAPLLFELTFKLSPPPFKLIRIHNCASFLALSLPVYLGGRLDIDLIVDSQPGVRSLRQLHCLVANLLRTNGSR